MGFLQRFGEGWHRNAYGKQLVIGIGNQCHHAKVEDGQVHLDVLVNLPLAQCRITVEGLIGFVHQFEDGLTVVLGNLLGRCVFLYLEVILALDEVGDALVLVGYGIRNVDFVLHPIGILLKSHALHMLRIVGIVINGGHGAELVESFDEHTFGIEICESQRALYMCHSPFFSPFFHGANQGIGDFRIIDEVYPAEADFLFVPGLVCLVVDDGSYTSYDFTFPISQEIVGFTKFECSVFLLVEGVEHVIEKVGDGIRVVFV